MFISRKAYQDLQDELTKARAELMAQSRANQMLEATMNWFRHRLTQIEAERAQLIHHALGVKIPTPTFDRVPDFDTLKKNMMGTVDEMDIFSGLSDEQAREHGVDWNEDGELVYRK